MDIKAIIKTAQVINGLQEELEDARKVLRRLVDGESMEKIYKSRKLAAGSATVKALPAEGSGRQSRISSETVLEKGLARTEPFRAADILKDMDLGPERRQHVATMLGLLAKSKKLAWLERGVYFRPLKKGEKVPDIPAEKRGAQ